MRWLVVAAVVEPRLPEPMTPERADLLARRWRWGLYACLAVDLALYFLGMPPLVLAVPLFGALWCIESRAECRGWLAGYRAARREELERQASGDPR